MSYQLTEIGPAVSYRPGQPVVGLLNANPFAEGIANLGAQVVAATMIDNGWNVGFGFADTVSVEAPLLGGVSVHECAMLAVSVPFESTYHHIPRLLRHCGVAAYSADRDDATPVVVAGGMSLINPMPLSPFFDAMVIGEGRDVLTAIGERVLEGRRKGLRRREIVAGLAELAHVYVPSLYELVTEPTGEVSDLRCDAAAPQEITVARPLNMSAHPIHSIWTTARSCYDHGDYYSIMVAMGCHLKCPFCVVGNTQGSIGGRALNSDLKSIQELAEARRDRYGTSLVKLFFASAFSHSSDIDPVDLKALLDAMLTRGFSCRVGSLNVRQADAELIELIRRGGQRRVTFAPETAEGLRPSLGKAYSKDGRLLLLAGLAERVGLGLDLYTMLGVPGERPADVRGLGALIRDVRGALGRSGNLRVSVNPVFCKAQTPYERYATLRPEAARARYSRMRWQLSDVTGIEWLSVIYDAMAYYQPVLALGGPELAPVLDRLSVHYRPSENDWRAAVADLVPGGDSRYFSRRPETARLPWQHIVVNDHAALSRRLRSHIAKAVRHDEIEIGRH